jgi:hypothetical protein
MRWCLALPLVLALSCRSGDRSPEAAARGVWEAVLAGDGARFRALYPSDEEIRALFEPEMASRLLARIQGALGALPRRRPPVEVLDVRILGEIEAPAGAGLRAPAHLARARLRIRFAGAESEDEIPLVRLAGKWRALPKEALRFAPLPSPASG